jgi:uncharacterized membrane protein
MNGITAARFRAPDGARTAGRGTFGIIVSPAIARLEPLSRCWFLFGWGLEGTAMPEPDGSPNDLPPHIEQSVRSIARLHDDHRDSATPRERAVERVTSVLGRANSIVALGLAVVVWIGGNLVTAMFGQQPLDPPPFVGLTTVISVSSFFLVILILASEQRADSLAERREQLTLELAILNERKTAKVIQLLEAARREVITPRDTTDPEATEMAQPADPEAVIAAIDATNQSETNRAIGRRSR